MKKIAYFVCFLYFSFLNPIDIFIGSIEKHKDNFVVNLNIDIDDSEMICKDDILISVDEPNIVVDGYQIINYSQEEVSLAKINKKAYRNPFVAKILLKGNFKSLNVLDMYFSCFLINEEEEFEPFIKKISYEFEDVCDTKDFSKKVKNKIGSKIKNAYMNLSEPVKKISIGIFNAKVLTMFLVIIVFFSFVLFSVLSLEDLLVILIIFSWVYFSRFVFIEEISLFFLAVLFLISSIWFFMNFNYGKSFFQRGTRLFLGFIFASLILPIFLEVYLSRCFLSHLRLKDHLIHNTIHCSQNDKFIKKSFSLLCSP